MGSIYLVRHGQAAFGTDDYDRLTERGFEQARLLGRYVAHRGVRFDALFTGTLRRHVETADGILQGLDQEGAGHRLDAKRFPGLNEYNPEALVEALNGPALPADHGAAERRDPAVVREHFRLLRTALVAWAEGRTKPKGMPSWADFQSGAVDALVQARTRHPDGNVLIVSSGGPISAIVCDALEAPPHIAVQLNLRVRNCSVSEFATNPKRHHLVAFNGVAHIETLGTAEMITYA